MANRHNKASHFENHQRVTELRDEAAHVHTVAEHQGKEDHLTGPEHSRQALEHLPDANARTQAATVGHGIAAFGHKDIAALAYELWQARGCPFGSSQEDWYRAVEELRSRSYGQ